jgi:hypothetical protein
MAAEPATDAAVTSPGAGKPTAAKPATAAEPDAVAELGLKKPDRSEATSPTDAGSKPEQSAPASAATSASKPEQSTPEQIAHATATDGAKPHAETKAGQQPTAPGPTTAANPEAPANAGGREPSDGSIGAKKMSDESTGAKKAGDDNADGTKTGDEGTGKATVPAPSAAAVAAASQGRATRVLRRANPVRVAKSTARTTSAWAKRPSGRLILPALIAALLLGAAGTAGVYLVPKALESVPSPSATPGFGGDAAQSAGSAVPPSASGLPGLPSAPVAGATLPGAQPPPVGGARPADVLTSWAQQAGTKAGIPVVAVQAYGYAELVVGRTTPSCHLSWTTIAAIAKVETAHGSANGAVLNVDGSVAPPIFGLPLDGKGGRQEIRDTDQGALDGDTQFDRAVGPLQFVPQAWTSIAVGNSVDADNNGVSDPNDIDDAALAAAKLLCQGGRDLAKPDAWWDAVLSYNAVRPRAQQVFDAANDYGQRSRV